jgi:hypothetical protein
MEQNLDPSKDTKLVSANRLCGIPPVCPPHLSELVPRCSDFNQS